MSAVLEPVFPPLVTLETERLVLRALTLDDAEDIFAYASDPEVVRYLPWEHHRSLEDSREFITRTLEAHEAGARAEWGMVLKESGRVVGTCGFCAWAGGSGRAELGYCLGREHWGRGLVTEAARRIVRYGFEDCMLNRIEAVCDVDNIGSARVMEKCGMIFEGVMRRRLLMHDSYRDMKMYAILREDWIASQE
ncbi:MAG: GNAT family N-acetyltransferase [Armatimonadetes bacterium]|nr:GNAT family N-acetyltransferase [Armatimonadota bacterium]